MNDQTLTADLDTPETYPDADILDAADLTPETLDPNRIYSLEELAHMPAAVLEELWLACPDKPFYEAALRRAVDDTYGRDAVPSDMDQLSVIQRCLLYYTGDHPDLSGRAPRIPVTRRADGSVQWFKVSDRIREHVTSGTPLDDETAELEAGSDVRRILPVIVAGLTLLCVGIFLVRSLAGGDTLAEADRTATLEAEQALEEGTVTPTPLALDNIDRPIEAGENLRGYYPVLLEIDPAASPARVFPVQQREVDIAEWVFDADPDVASAVLGLVVQPVLGIPYSPSNATFLTDLQRGDAIRLRMSTGQTLAFTVTATGRVDRQAVALFAQDSPGIALVLLGDPAGDRLVVRGEYLVAQEQVAIGTGNVTTIGQDEVGLLGDGMAVTVTRSTREQGTLAPENSYQIIDLTLVAQSTMNTGDLTVELLDPSGRRYTPVNAARNLLSHDLLTPTDLASGDTLTRSVAFITPGAPAAYVLVVRSGEATVRVVLNAPQLTLNADHLEVMLTEVTFENDDLLISARLYNPHTTPITLMPADVRLVTSPVARGDTFPIGPPAREASGLLPLTVVGGSFQDVVFRFPWGGDALIGLEIGGYQFIADTR